MIISTKELIETKELPRFNEIHWVSSPTAMGTTQPYSYKTMVNLVKKSPEVVGIMRAIQTDICSDGFSFEGAKKNIDKATAFVKTNRFKSQFEGCILDWLMLGNGALWKGKVSKERVKETLDKLQIVTGVEYKETEIKALMDEDVFISKIIKHAPWSTMNIDLNAEKTSVVRFRQITNDDSRAIIFEPEEIIHGKFMEFDGKVYGFSPLEASVNVVSTLLLIKDLNGAFFENGGVPDWMFIFTKEHAGSPNVKKLESALRKYKDSRNKHGNLIFTGEVEREQLNKFDKDMEFRQMAIYYTGIIALAFNMPMARVAAIIGSEVSAGAAATDLSEAGYWRGISSYQDYWEDLLNTQLFEPEFKVTIRFNRGYLNDEIKEAQRDVQMFEVLNKLALAGAINTDYIKFKLKIPDYYWTGKFNAIPEGIGGGFGNENGSPGSSPKKTEKGSARQEYADGKKKQATEAAERKEKKSVDAGEFDKIVQDYVKKSQTRKVDWYKEGETMHFQVDTPESSFVHSAKETDLSAVKKADWIGFGRKIESSSPNKLTKENIKKLSLNLEIDMED